MTQLTRRRGPQKGVKGIRWAQAAVTRNPNNLAPHSLAWAQLQPHDTLKQTFLSLSRGGGTNKHLFITNILSDGAELGSDRYLVSAHGSSDPPHPKQKALFTLFHEAYQSTARCILPLPARLLLPSSGIPPLGKPQSAVRPGSFCAVGTVGVRSGGAEWDTDVPLGPRDADPRSRADDSERGGKRDRSPASCHQRAADDNDADHQPPPALTSPCFPREPNPSVHSG